jgi:hypothetical protein
MVAWGVGRCLLHPTDLRTTVGPRPVLPCRPATRSTSSTSPLRNTSPTRHAGAATERRYQATAQSYRLPEALIADTEPAQLGQLLGSVFDLAKLDLVDFVERGGMAIPNVDQHVALSLSHMQLTPSRQSELVGALIELVHEYTDDPITDETQPFAMFVAAFPPDDQP